MAGGNHPAGANTTYSLVGIREDLEDIIYNISPMDTIFLSRAAKMRAYNTLHEWQTDELSPNISTNQVPEGADHSAPTQSATTRLKNYCSIARKDFVIAGTSDVVRKAGRAEETAYQTVRNGKSLKRDIETHLLAMTVSITAGSGNNQARVGAGVESWIYTDNHIKPTNVTTATTPAPASGFAQVTVDGSATALTKASLDSALQQAWSCGGETDTVLVGPTLQAKISDFSSIATRFRDVGSRQQAQIVASSDVYVSAFGAHNIVLSRYCRVSSVLCLDMSTWGIAWLRPIFTENLAKTGDSTKKMILGEYALVAKSPTANAKIVGQT